MRHRMRRGVLLDRSAILLHQTNSKCATAWSDLDFLPMALDALRLFAENDVVVILISDYSNVKTGRATRHEFDRSTRRMLLEVALSGGNIEKTIYCPHSLQEHCFCHKPFPGLLLRAMAEGGLCPASTCMIGSDELDLLAANRAGCRGILVRRNSFLTMDTRDNDSLQIASNLYEAAERIVGQNVPRLADILQIKNGLALSPHRGFRFDFPDRVKDLA